MRRLSSLVLVVLATIYGCLDGVGPGGDIRAWTLLDPPVGQGSSQPHLSSNGDNVVLSWLEPGSGDGTAFRYALLDDRGWRDGRTVFEGGDLLVNWADFPSLIALENGGLIGHWISTSDGYGIRVSKSPDQVGWDAPWIPHEDRSPAEHGFVSFFPLGPSTAGLIWLDGRELVAQRMSEAHQEPERPGMNLLFREMLPSGDWGPEVLLDAMTCECCQTDAAITSVGPVVVYRDRSPDEIRDIGIVRLVNGEWTDPIVVHEDGWEMSGCPVNGPAVAARGADVAVAWFTGAGEGPSVKLAFSADAGANFGLPIEISSENPAGRVDVEVLRDGSALVSWVERKDGEGHLLIERVLPGGLDRKRTSLTDLFSADPAGYPQLAQRGSERILVAWTESGQPGTVKIVEASLEDL